MRPAVLAAVALLAGAGGGALSSRALGEAHAETAGAVVVPVPPQGVVFRSSRGGNAIARVRSEGAGGVVEILDAREQVVIRLRATSAGGVIELGASPVAAHPALSLVRSPDDPGY
jgi:hypothetical protein